MGGQDREDPTDDVEMSNSTGPSLVVTSHSSPPASELKKQDTGKTHADRDTNAPHASHPGAVQQGAPSDATGNSLFTTPSSQASATATSVIPDRPPTCTELPLYDDQEAQIKALVEKDKVEGQKGFVVSIKWWSRVLARCSHPSAVVDKSASEGEVGHIDNASLAMVTEDSGKLLDLAGDKFVLLRPGLRYTEDYLIVPEEAWDLLVSWYGTAKDSPVITRYAYDVNIGGDDYSPPNIDYETDPPVFTFLKVPGEHTAQTQKEVTALPPKLVASKYMAANDWLKMAKELVHVDLNTKVRVWRILGGLKSHAPSGLPSPAASRSSSPAPGTELVATIPDKMLLDVNTFVSLPTGEHREDLNITDNTANQKYDGKSHLGIYTGKGELIALEETKKNGDWPSETNRLALPRNAKDKAKGIAASGRTSPSPGMTTRGRSMRQGKPKGNIGLTNLGNTCYMNAALQSIRSVQELTEYFLHEHWKPELNTKNVLGHQGNMARAYANLIKGIFTEKGGAFSPRDFKSVIGRYNPSFNGYGQQDSQEFLLFLLDGLSEDLNRIKKKPYIEKPDSTDEMVKSHQALKDFADRNWSDYLQRNDSIVTDLFAGMYKSMLTCPICDKVSIIFDPFTNITLQLPVEAMWSMQCVFLPLYGPPKHIDVEVSKNASIKDVKDFVSTRVNVASDKLMISEGYKSRFYKVFDNVLGVSEAQINPSSDIIFIHELEDVPTNYNPNKKPRYSNYSGVSSEVDAAPDPSSPAADRLLVPVFHRYQKNPNDNRKVSQRPFFAYGSYIVINREENKSFDAVMRKVLTKAAGMTTRKILEENNDAESQGDSSDAVVVNDDSSRSAATSTEDGFVDVPMREGSTAPNDDDRSVYQSFAKSRGPVPSAHNHLFRLGATTTDEGIPTGWNAISEHDDFTDVYARWVAQHKNDRSASSDSESPDELGDIQHDASTPESDVQDASAEDSSMGNGDGDETAAMFGNFKAQRREKRVRKVYSRKGKKIEGKNTQQRSPYKLRQQRTPPNDDVDMVIRPGEAIICDWSFDAHGALFGGDRLGGGEDGERGSGTWKNVPVMEDSVLAQKRATRNKRKKDGVTLQECLDEFGKPEILSDQNLWYCPQCKDHRRAEKKFELWKIPDILIIHIKRFSSVRNFRDKLDIMVDYPVEGLDMTKYVQDPDDGKSLIYDLIAVDNHYGGLGGGHYTAFAKNYITGDWLDYNDGHVSRRDAASVVSSNAYMLFYRRRQDYPLGGPKVAELLDSGEAEEAGSEPHSRDTSADPGEGRRLGDSSRNGLSRPGAVDPVHQLGAGGLASQDQSVDQEMVMDGVDPVYESPERLSYGPPSYQPQDWGFDLLSTQPANSVGDNDDAGSVDSTKAEGGPTSDLGSDEDVPMFSDSFQHVEDSGMRGVRESAPPPDLHVVSSADAMDDDDDEALPVVELHANPSAEGGMDVSYVSK